AAATDKLILLRSLVGLIDEHSSFQSMTGFPMGLTQREGKPHFGSVLARTQGPIDPVIPPFIDLSPTMQHKPYNTPGPGLLGRSPGPVKLDGQDLAAMKLQALTVDQLGDRRRLLQQVDQYRRAADGSDRSGMDTYYQRAFDVLTSRKLVDALDVTR